MRIVNKNGFFSLVHSFRRNGKVMTREKYLGKSIPKDIEQIKEKFQKECMSQVYDKLNLIRKKFQKEWKSYPETIKKKMLTDLSVDFTYNSNAIEGSTITLDETEELIRGRISPNKPLSDVQETINHSKVFLKAITKKRINMSQMLEWHREIFNDTKGDIAGTIRDYGVRVGSYRAPDWQDVKKLLKELFKWYDLNKKMHPVEVAARMHYRFEKILPFGDGNGRIGRIIIAQVLRSAGYPLLIIEYKKRKSYYRALSKSEDKFVQYFFRRYMAQNKKYLEN